jgi:hypothetical protein
MLNDLEDSTMVQLTTSTPLQTNLLAHIRVPRCRSFGRPSQRDKERQRCVVIVKLDTNAAVACASYDSPPPRGSMPVTEEKLLE